jgi:hypothetical protein
MRSPYIRLNLGITISSVPRTFVLLPSPMSSKRGRKRNDNLPPNRAREVQRAFRARRAAHLQVLFFFDSHQCEVANNSSLTSIIYLSRHWSSESQNWRKKMIASDKHSICHPRTGRYWAEAQRAKINPRIMRISPRPAPVPVIFLLLRRFGSRPP